MTEYLKILDQPAVQSKEHFMLACAVAGLPIDDEKYEAVVAFEIGQLSNIKEIANMFDKNAEMSLFAYKKIFRLVEYAGVVTDGESLARNFSVKTVSDGNAFNMSMDLMEDMHAIYGIDTDAVTWNILKSEVLKR